MPRPRTHESDAARVSAYRNRKRALDLLQNGLEGQLVLELFPGAGLFGKAFEAAGATVVRGPDILWGGNVKDFKGIKGKFDGIIGGPPCQVFSKAAITGTAAINLIPDFLRVVSECLPTWAVMENVREAKHAAPQDWNYVSLRDFDCGGLTYRQRGFWFYGMPAAPKPVKRMGEPEYSVLASNWNQRGTNKLAAHNHLTAHEAARLQGFPDLADKIIKSQPGWLRESGYYMGVSNKSRECLAVHMLGNGVPRALGFYVAAWIAFTIDGKNQLFRDAMASYIKGLRND